MSELMWFWSFDVKEANVAKDSSLWMTSYNHQLSCGQTDSHSDNVSDRVVGRDGKRHNANGDKDGAVSELMWFWSFTLQETAVAQDSSHQCLN